VQEKWYRKKSRGPVDTMFFQRARKRRKLTGPRFFFFFFFWGGGVSQILTEVESKFPQYQNVAAGNTRAAQNLSLAAEELWWAVGRRTLVDTAGKSGWPCWPPQNPRKTIGAYERIEKTTHKHFLYQTDAIPTTLATGSESNQKERFNIRFMRGTIYKIIAVSKIIRWIPRLCLPSIQRLVESASGLSLRCHRG